MKIEIGKTYRIYGKIGSMRRMKPLAGDHFVNNLIYAEMFTPAADEDIAKIERELKSLNSQGTFELREVV